MAKIIEINATTGEEIIREMTPDELKQLKADQDAESKKIAELKKIAESRATLLEKLGITEEEAKLLLS